MDLSGRIDALFSNFRKNFDISLVFGEIREVKGKSILPVASLVYGFGVCSCGKKKREEESQTSGNAGGGGRAKLHPLGVFEITEESTRFVPVITLKEVFIVIGMLLVPLRKKKIRRLIKLFW